MAIFPAKLMNKGAFIANDDKYWTMSFCGLINDKKLSIRSWAFVHEVGATWEAMPSGKVKKRRINLPWYKYFYFYLAAFLFDSGHRGETDFC